jgi:hypothetical protein
MCQAPADRAVAPRQLAVVEGTQLANLRDAVARQPLGQGGADAPDQPDRLGAEELGRFSAPDDREAARLVEIGGDLGEELVVAEPDRDGDADLALDAAGQLHHRMRRRAAVQQLGAGQVEKGLVDREWLNQRRRLAHERPHRAADGAILRHVGADDDGIRTGLERLEHRHRGAHAVEPRDVAAGEDDAALATADDYRLVGERRVVAFLDAGVKGVAIEMRDRERIELGVAEQASRAAGPAAPVGGLGPRLPRRAIAANPAHREPRTGHSQAAPRTPLESP